MGATVSGERIEWENISGNVEMSEETFFDQWLGLEHHFGEFGQPGYSETMLTHRGGMFGAGNQVNVRYTLFRDESGKLLCVHGYYMEDGIHKGLTLKTHPDHQRQGLGTMMLTYVRDRHERETGETFTYNESLQGATMTGPVANLINKTIANENAAFDQGEGE